MRPETERVVRESWAQFEPVAVESAAFFYDKLFELDPEAQRLFAKTDMVAQGHKVMRMFAEIVHNLDRPEALVAEVADLGRRHVGYGVQDHQYDSVGTALLWTLERGWVRPSPTRSGMPGPKPISSSRASCGGRPPARPSREATRRYHKSL